MFTVTSVCAFLIFQFFYSSALLREMLLVLLHYTYLKMSVFKIKLRIKVNYEAECCRNLSFDKIKYLFELYIYCQQIT